MCCCNSLQLQQGLRFENVSAGQYGWLDLQDRNLSCPISWVRTFEPSTSKQKQHLRNCTSRSAHKFILQPVLAFDVECAAGDAVNMEFSCNLGFTPMPTCSVQLGGLAAEDCRAGHDGGRAVIRISPVVLTTFNF